MVVASSQIGLGSLAAQMFGLRYYFVLLYVVSI
jgi:hypothetical protein